MARSQKDYPKLSNKNWGFALKMKVTFSQIVGFYFQNSIFVCLQISQWKNFQWISLSKLIRQRAIILQDFGSSESDDFSALSEVSSSNDNGSIQKIKISLL